MANRLNELGNYSPFGLAMKGRTWSNPAANQPRYGFNGKEDDPETSTQDYGFRIYNPRIAKFLSVDPLTKQYPELTPYQFAGNTPIQAIDLDGLEPYNVNNRSVPASDHLYNKNTPTVNGVTVHKLGKPNFLTQLLVDIAMEDLQYENANKVITGYNNNGNKIGVSERINSGLSILTVVASWGPRPKISNGPKPKISNSVNESGGLSNLSRANKINLDKFDANSGTGFSGVYDVETCQFVMYPSGGTTYKNNVPIPPNRIVDQYGGHNMVNRALTREIGAPVGKRVGFSITYDENGVFKIGWNSNTINTPNFGNRTAPIEHQEPIINALQKEYNVKVVPRR